MVDVDRVEVEDVKPKKESPVDMIRVACYVKDVDKAIFLANHFADKGYETTINIMAISHALDNELTEALHQLEEECKAHVIYIVDSFGALYQESVEFLVKKFKGILKSKEVRSSILTGAQIKRELPATPAPKKQLPVQADEESETDDVQTQAANIPDQIDQTPTTATQQPTPESQKQA